MKTSIGEAALLTAVMAAVIFFCRSCAFFFFRGKKPRGGAGTEGTAVGSADESGGTADNGGKGDSSTRCAGSTRTAAFLDFVEKTVPPLAMTVLTFNALAAPMIPAASAGGNFRQGIPVLAAAAFTVIVHLWRRNPLISIFGGTAVYMALERIVSGYCQ